MSNWGTAIERLAEETVRSSGNEDAKFARCLESSLKYISHENLWFNQASYEFNLTDSVAAYGQETDDGDADGYPSDFLKVRLATLQLDGTSTYHPLGAPITIEEYRKAHAHDDDTGYPQAYAFYANELLFIPTPNDSHAVTIDYTQNLGVPVNSFADGVWATKVNGSAVTPEYTNQWFTNGQELLIARARFYWYTRFDRNRDQSLTALADFNEERKQLLKLSRKFIKPRPTRPWV